MFLRSINFKISSFEEWILTSLQLFLYQEDLKGTTERSPDSNIDLQAASLMFLFQSFKYLLQNGNKFLNFCLKLIEEPPEK